MVCGRRLMFFVPVLILALGGCGGSDISSTASVTAHPQLMAPGVINTGMNTRDTAMTPDGREMYFCMAAAGYRYAVILVTRFEDGAWTEPVVAPFSGSTEWVDIEPFISPDGSRFFFMSTRPEAGEQEGESDIWVMDRKGDRWGEPWNLGAPVNSDRNEYFPAVTRDGTLYFTRADSTERSSRIYRSRFTDGAYGEPELLPEEVNCGRTCFNATISSDESRLIVSAVGVPGSHGAVDYFMALRDEEDRWTGPINLGPVINDGSRQSWSPYLTPDGEAFVFMSSRRSIPEPAWPPRWSDLQSAHRSPGGGNPNLYMVRADFLDSLVAGAPLPESPETIHAWAAPTVTVPFPELTGPYLGQEPPGVEPRLFAAGIVSTGMIERDLVISPDGGTIWYGFMGQGMVTIMETRLEEGHWSEPAPVPFHLDKDFACFEPTLSADGKTVLFLSNQAAPGQEQGRGWANQNIFRSRFQNGKWTDPVALPAPVTTEAAEYFPSLATDGSLYFSRQVGQGQTNIWVAEPLGDGYDEPLMLPGTVNVATANYNATVAPDESWIIVCVGDHEENLGAADYWISFRDTEGSWAPAVNMGPRFNGPGQRASSVSLSPDGRFLFFSSDQADPEKFFSNGQITRKGMGRLHTEPGNGSSDVWWVDVEVLKRLK